MIQEANYSILKRSEAFPNYLLNCKSLGYTLFVKIPRYDESIQFRKGLDTSVSLFFFAYLK
jgi:hypothetical protein